MRSLGGTEDSEDYFAATTAYPLVELPWRQAQGLTGEADPDPAFFDDLVDSTVSGYYFLRMIDNVMDGDGTVEVGLLPALSFFHARFQGALGTHFPAGHPFWQDFHAVEMRYLDVTIRDAQLQDIDLEQFLAISAQKFCGGAIPLAAVCHHWRQPERIAQWRNFLALLGAWYQMRNDVIDWARDHQRGATTYFLQEAERRRSHHQGVSVWVLEEGFPWAMELMKSWMAKLMGMADQLACPGLSALLTQQQELLRQKARSVEDAVRGLETLWQTFPDSGTAGQHKISDAQGRVT